jgi:8-oxo-dGTP diphosphatase
MNTPQQFPILAASVCLRHGDSVLLVQRGKEPGLGKWAFPGGKLLWGERTVEGALRELREETGLSATIGPLIALYDVVQPTYHFVIACYFAHAPQGILKADSDAANARWLNINEVGKLPLASNIAEALTASVKFIHTR